MSIKQIKSAVVFLMVSAVVIIGALFVYNVYSMKDNEKEPLKFDTDGSISGTFHGKADGFGGDIDVTLDVEKNQIVNCIIEAPGETPDIGGKHISKFQQEVIDNNGTIDAVSGATVTSNGVKAAVQNALDSAGFSSEEEYSMKPGTYIGKAHGFSNIDYVTVSINVTEDSIVDIVLLDTFTEDQDSYENPNICKGAFQTLGAEITTTQSIDADAVSGATGSSNGIKSAIRSALIEAYMSNDLSEEAAVNAVNKNFTGNKADKEERIVKLEYDIVVIGAGASGTTASLTALDEGAKVLNIEKTFRWGGQSMMTGGPKAYNPETTEEEALAVYDEYEKNIEAHRFGEEDQKWNDEQYKSEHLEEYTPVNKEAYMATVAASGKGIKKIVEYGMHFVKSTMDFTKIYSNEQMDFPEGLDGFDMSDMDSMMKPDDNQSITVEDVDHFEHTGEGTGLTYSMAEIYYDSVFNNYVLAGGDYLLNTSAKELIYSDNSKESVVGVRAYNENGTIYEVYAKAIILATGGYGGNEELMDQWALGGEDWIYYGWQGNDGDGILMAMDAGANPYNLEAYPMSHQRMGQEFITKFEVQTLENGQLWSPNDLTVVLAVNNDGVYMTEEGENFITDDMGTMSGFSHSMGTYYIGSSYYVVYSEQQLQEYREQGITDTATGFQNVGEGIPADYPLGDWVDVVLEEAENQGFCWKVNSLSEGDSMLGFDEGTFQAAYDKDGTDANNSQNGPYYIIKCAGLAISSCGGVEVNENMQAVREDKTVIENLFVIGNDGFGNIMATGAEYPIGGDAGMFVFGSGYVAGEKAAELIK